MTPIPDRLTILGETILILERPMADLHGAWDEESGVVTIDPRQDEYSKRETLLHELMHVVESKVKADGGIRRSVAHNYIDQGAPWLLLLLSALGWTDVSQAEIEARWEELKR